MQELCKTRKLEDTGRHLHCECNIAARAARTLPEGGCIGEPLTALFSRCSLSTYDVPDAALYIKGAARRDTDQVFCLHGACILVRTAENLLVNEKFSR